MDTRAKQRQSHTEARGIQSVEVGVNLLSAFLDATQPLMLREIADFTGCASAQVHAYMVSFRRMGLVEQDPKSGRYRLGNHAMNLAAARLRSFDAMKAAGEAVEALCNETQLTVALAVWGSFGPNVVMVRNGSDTLYIDTRPGTVYSITGTATGMLFASYMPEQTIQEALKAEARENGRSMRVGKLRSHAAVRDEITGIRQLGYATIADPPVPGTKAVSAPVFDHTGQLQMAITLIGNEQSVDFSGGSPDILRLLATTERLSFEHGYIGPCSRSNE